MARTPHGYHDEEAIARDLAQGGFAAAPRIELVAARSRAESAAAAAMAYCQGTPLRNEIEARGAAQGVSLAAATAAAAKAIAQRFGQGPVDGKVQARVVMVVK